MVGNTGSLMTMRFVRSKLRKREEQLTTLSTIEGQHTNFGQYSSSFDFNDQQFHTSKTIISGNKKSNLNAHQGDIAFSSAGNDRTAQTDWIFPPKVGTSPIQSYNSHTADHDGTRPGLKRFQKQFSGRFKKLIISKRNERFIEGIPPELKPQLKSIYVY